MRKPTITQYIESISDSFGLFRTLDNISVVRDSYDYPIFRSGNYSVIFKVVYGGVSYGLKCYTRQPDYMEEVYGFVESIDSESVNDVRLFQDEFYVYDEYDRGRYHSVLLVRWIDGETLGRYVARLCNDADADGLKSLAEKFDHMALWVLEQDFAHGDLKHDNILVASDGTLKLIDFDGMYLPSFAGRTCTLIGSAAFQHPKRDATFFDSSIDDYPLGVISLSLHALAEDPSLYVRYNDRENLIFNAIEISGGNSVLFETLIKKWAKDGNLAMLSLAMLLRSSVPGLPKLPQALSQMVTTRCQLDGYEVVDSADPKCAIVTRNSLFGFADTINLDLLLDSVYSTVHPFSSGLSLVEVDGNQMFINKRGACVIDCSAYQSVAPFRNSLSLVCSGGKFGFIDTIGTVVIALEYTFATSFRGGVAIVRVGDNYGCIDSKGTLVVPATYNLDECRELHCRSEYDINHRNNL